MKMNTHQLELLRLFDPYEGVPHARCGQDLIACDRSSSFLHDPIVQPLV